MDNSQTYATFGTRHRTKTNKQKQNTIEKINMVSNMDPHYKQPGSISWTQNGTTIPEFESNTNGNKGPGG
jgi:hypothetical protein